MLKKLLVANLKFKCDWLSCLIWFCCCCYYFAFMSAKSGNPNPHTTMEDIKGLRFTMAAGLWQTKIAMSNACRGREVGRR